MPKPSNWHSLLEREDSGGAVPFGVSVGTASILVRRTNTKRKRIFIQNASDAALYLWKADTAALGGGVLLYPGMAWYEVADSLGYLYVGPFSAICNLASKMIIGWEE